jgi:GTPase-associated protein 1, N-terminal domain type 2/GTPase-associated protein 1, C-terminal domain/GTPase-associated protein 1, middle domain
VAFLQLCYTSCEHGLAGYGGYQFNAITPGTPPVLLREVEERTVYEPPRSLLADPEDPEAYPVAFSYGMSEATAMAVTTHVVFTGTDYSGRPGNYFAHALATSAPERDFEPLLPAELWGADFWRTVPVGGTELPEMPGPLPRGVIDRPGTQAFLDARGAETALPELLTAVGRAMSGEQPVLVVNHDVTENAWWIAAISYLLGEHLAYQMTFTTYSHRPGYARYHLTGVLPDTLPPGTDKSFLMFDFAAGRTPGHDIHPAAALLASTGVMASGGLWRQAAAFASGAEKDLDDWLGPVALAAGLLGQPLSPGVTDAVARWLPVAEGRMPAQLTDVALGVLLTQPAGTLSSERLTGLLALARRLASPAKVEQAERLLADQAIADLMRGEAATPVRFRSPAAEAARARAADLLEEAPPTMVPALLEWAAASGVLPPEADLERYGRTRLDPAGLGPGLARMLPTQPAVLRGLLGRLAAEPPEVAETALSGPLGTRLSRDDLAGHPELTELWLLQSVIRGDIGPLQAFDEIADVRAQAERSPRADESLLHLLWPRGCPPDQLADLLGFFQTEPATPAVADWITAQVSAVTARETPGAGWLRLAYVLAEHPILAMLPDSQACSVRNVVRISPLVEQARLRGPKGDVDVFDALFTEYATTDDVTRRMLNRTLPVLLVEADPLGMALRGCPQEVAAAFCARLDSRLVPPQPDVALARRVFGVLTRPAMLGQPGLQQRLTESFEQVRTWPRRDLSTLAKMLENDPGMAGPFRLWRDAHRGGLARKILGGAAGPDPPAQRQ